MVDNCLPFPLGMDLYSAFKCIQCLWASQPKPLSPHCGLPKDIQLATGRKRLRQWSSKGVAGDHGQDSRTIKETYKPFSGIWYSIKIMVFFICRIWMDNFSKGEREHHVILQGHTFHWVCKHTECTYVRGSFKFYSGNGSSSYVAALFCTSWMTRDHIIKYLGSML